MADKAIFKASRGPKITLKSSLFLRGESARMVALRSKGAGNVRPSTGFEVDFHWAGSMGKRFPSRWESGEQRSRLHVNPRNLITMDVAA